MAKMPDIFGGLVREWDQAERAVAEHLPHHHAAPQTPAEAPATMAVATAAAATPQEEPPMSLSVLEKIRTAVEDANAKFEGLDEEALGWLNAISANPEAKTILSDLAGLASVAGLPVGTITGVGAGIKTVMSLYAQDATATQPQDPAQQAPAPAQQ